MAAPNVYSKGIYESMNYEHLDVSDVWNLEARILPHHAARTLLARNMQSLFLNSRFGPACFGQGKRRAARHLFLFPRSILRRRSLGYKLNHASCCFSVTAHAIRYSVLRMVLAGQQACPQGLLSCFLVHLVRFSYPISQRIILVYHCVPVAVLT